MTRDTDKQTAEDPNRDEFTDRNLWREVFEWLRELLKRRAYYGFCLTLIGMGVGVLSLPVAEMLIAIAVSLFGIDPPSMPPWRNLVESAAGCGLIICGIVLANRHRRSTEVLRPVPPDSIKLSFVEGNTFEQAARAIVKVDEKPIKFEGFTDMHLASKLVSYEVAAKDIPGALKNLWSMTDGLPRYRVEKVNSVFHIKARRN